MDDKIFDLLEKMYLEIQDVKENMATKEELYGVKQELQGVKANMATKQELQGVKQDIIRMENKMDENHKALYDGYKQSIEGIHELKKDIEKLTDRVDNQEIKLQVLKSAK